MNKKLEIKYMWLESPDETHSKPPFDYAQGDCQSERSRRLLNLITMKYNIQ